MFSKFWREKNEPILSVNLDNSINEHFCSWKTLHSVKLHPENKVIYWENEIENRLFKTHAPRALIKIIIINPWRSKLQPTLVFLPGKFHRWRSLGGYSPWGHKEWDTTERLHFHFQVHVHPKVPIYPFSPFLPPATVHSFSLLVIHFK